MGFWSQTSASPSYWETWTSRPRPRYLRTSATEYPRTPSGLGRPRRLQESDASVLAKFWRTYYGGSDWYLDCDEAFVLRYLRNPHVFIFGLFTNSTELIGTIVSTPLTSGYTHMSHGTTLTTPRVIEGLCVHPRFRSKGIAGYLIGCMDAFTSETAPVAHLWGRELSQMPVMSTAIRADTYAYIRCSRDERPISMIPFPWNNFRKLWIESSQHWTESCIPRIVASVPSALHEYHGVWILNNSTKGVIPIVVVANTHRKTREDKQIYEITWCGYLRENYLVPADGSLEFKRWIEEIASQYDGILFVSSAPTNGGATSDWKSPWIFGSSGVHAWYLYNYIPPAFGRCELLTIRDEL